MRAEMPGTEAQRVRDRYARRDTAGCADRYSPLRPEVLATMQELERAIVRWIHAARLAPVSQRTVLEVGCGSGANLLRFLQLGFQPGNLAGCELLGARAASARERLPAATRILVGDACEIDLPDGAFDVVCQFTVFTSLLDAGFRQRLAERMWRLARPGGGILWYDFQYDNPSNPEVRGVGMAEVRRLFPAGQPTAWRVTLAPPIARRACALHPSLYALLNTLPLLRTHLLCWIAKP